MSIQALSVFCEDIRQERNGQETLVGTLPDLIQIPNPSDGQAAFAKIAVYTKVYFTYDEEPTPFTIRISDSNGIVIGEVAVDEALIQRAYDASVDQPRYGLKNSTSFVLMTREAPRYIQVEIIRGETEILTGILRFERAETEEPVSVAPQRSRKSKKKLLSSGAAIARAENWSKNK